MCPFVLERLFAETFKIKRKEIASVRDGYIIKVNSSEELTRMKATTKIQDSECEVTDEGSALRMYNSTKGLIYVNEYDITRYDSFEEGLKRKYNVSDVNQASWIKSRNTNTTPFFDNIRTKQVAEADKNTRRANIYTNISIQS